MKHGMLLGMVALAAWSALVYGEPPASKESGRASAPKPRAELLFRESDEASAPARAEIGRGVPAPEQASVSQQPIPAPVMERRAVLLFRESDEACGPPGR